MTKNSDTPAAEPAAKTTTEDPTTSPDEHVSEVNRVAGIAKPASDPFDVLNPELFRLDQSELDQPVVKTALTAVPIRKPEPLEFIRVHPDPNYRMGPVPFIALKKSREFYLVVPTLRRELKPREYWIGEIFLATNRLEKPFLWITTIQSPTGRVSDWYNSGIECAERAMHEWVQIVADQDAGVYTVALAEDRLEEPEWPEQTFQELFRLAFKRRTVDSLQHPIFKQLRGKV
jgi:hypothetical protein